MIHLIIETTNKARQGDIENAYNVAINTCTRAQFIESLMAEMPNTIVGTGGNHIFVSEKNGTRIGMVTNI